MFGGGGTKYSSLVAAANFEEGEEACGGGLNEGEEETRFCFFWKEGSVRIDTM